VSVPTLVLIAQAVFLLQRDTQTAERQTDTHTHRDASDHPTHA